MSAEAPTGIKSYPPEGTSLIRIWRQADRLMFSLCCALWLIVMLLGGLTDQFHLAVITGAILVLLASGLRYLFWGSVVSRLGFAIVLLAFAGLLIQLGNGETEYHFSVFVLLSALLAYRDYLPLLAGAATAALHHILFNYLQQHHLFGVVVFVHSGWHMVFVHGLFVILQTIMLLWIARHMAADARAASEVAQLAAWINREPGYLTLVADNAASKTPFARTFSSTLGTMHSTLNQVNQSVVALLSEAESMLQRNANLSQRSHAQVGSLAQVASAMADMNLAAADTSDKTLAACQLAGNARHVAARGQENIDAARQLMDRVSEDSLRVSGVLELINSIAFQTNILALNASVEASRAGVHGRGFAVVATEVRTLAQRCENASEDIRQLINAAADSTQSGQRQVEHAGQTMTEVMSCIDALSQLISELSQMSEEQGSRTRQMKDSIVSIDQSVQDNLEHVAQTLQVAQQQQSMVNSLKQAISVFRLA
ncbi:methyl-accepting chemotaxis protein [Erwinia sp. OLTSP20]|uniref:methyl-accepting chemotaxis protein n=1 Tax=unclassified Erwinia TaxID=2622719 RepID=UPI000C197324|nr:MULTISPECIES: methyl-accepting chemotaxis protein [unclassified Erwinia]PIJ50322.1 methyl-accepting chemotaxis protein [Erwinia sp. OAMSP11]PIJ72159.1 methyl-accepting chemotaxis protein [Erwinia sp. OLSSP12]PIJ81450.1 methyl-accepting chemotaxis protein [Erwinia sp. OLCASP19]PIJ84156.1 methyl-accepting chemotaxis protein [Erwinia sp. OLMTSP26]PIJ85855.1 methyl-accepting chemotaxis protein [Erwinia sp. OLMDSP33]